MHPYPHEYRVRASGTATGPVPVVGDGLAAIDTFPPPEFDGPEGYWSPETLFMAAIADCYVLSFRAVARASKLQWDDIQVDAEGVLDRADGVAKFTEVRVLPTLSIPEGGSESLAQTVMEKAKRVCLVTNSLTSNVTLEAKVLVAA